MKQITIAGIQMESAQIFFNPETNTLDISQDYYLVDQNGNRIPELNQTQAFFRSIPWANVPAALKTELQKLNTWMEGEILEERGLS